MNKENNKYAAGLRRSAVAERIRLREEWSELKGPESHKTNILTKKQTNVRMAHNAAKNVTNANKHTESTRNLHLTNDTLRGVVALVEVGSECRALPLRAALSALGASVLPSWSPLVTHLVWTQGGCRGTRAKGRALACRLVSPLWVEACAAAARRLPEQAFPAAARASDLPSPRTLQRLLKKAEMENIPLADLLSDSNEDNPKQRLRISSETERDTSADTSKDTSRDTSHDTSKDTTNDTSTDIESRVNTAPRRALPKTSQSVSPVRPAKSRRKLFTHKEAELTGGSDESEENTAPTRLKKPSLVKRPSKPQLKVTQNRRELARAERMAKKLLTGCTQGTQTSQQFKPRIVLTGMCRTERRAVTEAIRSLGGRVQSQVNRRATHVLLGSCARDHNRTMITGITNVSPEASRVQCVVQKARTLNALCGAARGCRVLHAQWALHCKESGKWLHYSGYEVLHLKKISQKARLERTALGKQRSEYAYDVFSGMRVRIAADAEQRDAAAHLLTLCGAAVQDGRINKEMDGVQNGGLTQNGGRTQNGGLAQNGAHKGTQFALLHNHINGEYDIKIGKENGDISSKWVFDSVAAGRMRTTRRYVVNSLSESDLVSQMERFQC